MSLMIAIMEGEPHNHIRDIGVIEFGGHMPENTVQIDVELEERLNKLAATTGRTRAWIVQRALEEFLSQEEWMAKAIQDGIEAADRGDFASDAEVQATFARWGGDAKG